MRRILAVSIVLLPALWLAAPSAARSSVTLTVTPTRAPAGSSVQVSGTCEAHTGGYVLSHAFLHDAAHDFAGVGAVAFQTDASGNFAVTAQVPASITPGRYDVTGRCGGGNLGITAQLRVTAASGAPTAVAAGSGGRAATTSAHTEAEQLLLAGTGVVLLAASGLGLGRRRRATH